MPWIYANADKTIVGDGFTFIPLNGLTQDSRDMMAKIATGLVIGPFVPPIAAPVQYTMQDLQTLLIQKGIIPAPVSSSVTPSKVV